jgi:integrase
MHIRKMRKKWQCIVRCKGHMITQSFESKSDARMWGEKTKTDLRNGSYQNNDKLISMRFKDLLHLYLDRTMHKSKRAKILKYEIEMLRRSSLGSLSLASLSPNKISNFRDDRLRVGKSKTTVRKYLALMSRVITVGQRELQIPLQNNPFQLVEKPKSAPARERTLTGSELNKLFVACESDKKFHFLRAFVECLYLTLCRRGELLKLKKDDVNWTDSTAILRETKDNDKDRRIGLSPRVVELLQKLPRTVDGIFFPVRSISSFEKSFRAAVKRAGIKDFHVHDLRHCGSSNLIENMNWSTIELMQQGGWTSSAMAKRYSKISPKHLAKKLKQG